MAYIEKTAFWPRVTNRVFDETLNIAGKFQNADKADETCSAGFLCVKDELMDCEGYVGVGPTGSTVTIKNSNSWNMKATGAAVKSEGDGIYACNPYDVNMVQDPATGTPRVMRKISARFRSTAMESMPNTMYLPYTAGPSFPSDTRTLSGWTNFPAMNVSAGK